MNVLHVIFPQTRAEIVRLLFADPEKELHLRELSRLSDLAIGTFQTEVKQLAEAHRMMVPAAAKWAISPIFMSKNKAPDYSQKQSKMEKQMSLFPKLAMRPWYFETQKHQNPPGKVAHRLPKSDVFCFTSLHFSA